MAKSYNSVPLGRAGTGAAYVLGESQAANQFIDDLEYNRRVQQQNQALKQQYAQQLANDWKQNQLKIKGGTLWENDLQSAASEVMDLGTKLRQAGFNPYRPTPNDPIQMQASELFLNKQRQVEDMADYRDQVQKDLASQHDIFQKEIPGTFEQEDVGLLNNFPSQYDLQTAYGQGIRAPQLRKAFQEGEFIQKIKPTARREKKVSPDGIETLDITADLEKTRENVLGAYISDPRAAIHLQRQIGSSIQDVPGVGNSLLPETSDIEALKKANDDIYRSPQFQRELLENGINSYDSKEYENFIDRKARRQSEAYRNFNSYIDTKTKEVAAKQGITHDRGYNFAWRNHQIQEERLRLAKDRDARDRANESEGSVQPRNVNLPYNEGKANVNVKDFVGLSIPAKNFAGSPAYNMKTGERIPALASSNDYEVVGVGNFPFISDNVRDNNGKNLNGTLAQPDYEAKAGNGIISDKPMVHVQQRKNLGGVTVTNDYLVPYDRLPENVRNSKSVKQALSGFKPSQSQQQSQTVKPQGGRKAMGGYKIGQESKGYKYIGGDPSSPSSWQQIKK